MNKELCKYSNPLLSIKFKREGEVTKEGAKKRANLLNAIRADNVIFVI